MMPQWVRAGSWDVCLADVGAVKRLEDGGVKVYLRDVTEVDLDPEEAGLFLPAFGVYAGLEQFEAGDDAGGKVVAVDVDNGSGAI